MPTTIKRVLLWGSAALLLVLLIFFLIPKNNGSFSLECLRARIAVSRFLKAVRQGDAERAFRYVDCVSENGEPLDPDLCRAAWIARVTDLREGTAQTYLDDYSDLRVTKKDGVMTVTVRFSVRRQGFEDKFYAAGSTLTVTQRDGWKIRAVSSEPTATQTDWERALSGVFTPEELSEP